MRWLSVQGYDDQHILELVIEVRPMAYGLGAAGPERDHVYSSADDNQPRTSADGHAIPPAEDELEHYFSGAAGRPWLGSQL